MIAQLTGKLISKQPNAVIIDCGGVGYEVSIPLSTFYELGDPGSDISLRIHTYVREDTLQLFGFMTSLEKELFLRLTSVSGIGPKLAIAILSGLPAAELVPAIRTNNITKLTGIPGVGRKTAERLVIELRDKLAKIPLEEGELKIPAAAPVSDLSIKEDTVAALVALGYQKPVAERAVNAALDDGGDRSIESVLKRALKRLYK